MDRYEQLREAGTNGINYDVTNEDVIARFKRWETVCRFELSEIGHDRVTVTFETLPDDLDAFAQEIYEFCPDTIDQGLGCVNEMIDACEEMGQEVPENIQRLVEGVDLDDEHYGLVLLRKSLETDKTLPLWWD